MKTPSLHRLYGLLAIWERIPLLVSALSRKDEVDYQRLLEGSPLGTARLPVHLLPELALHVLALNYISEQLDLAGTYFFACYRREFAEGEDKRLLEAMGKASAFLFKVKTQAWRAFCAEVNVSPQALTAANHDSWFLPYCEEHLAALALSEAELEGNLQGVGLEVTQFVTPESLVARWKESLRAMSSRVQPPFAGGDR